MTNKKNDARLLRAYLAGKNRAFESLYKKYEKPLFSFILRFIGDRKNAEDIFQQTWFKVLAALPVYEERGAFAGWLFGIANNCCVDFVRNKNYSQKKNSTHESELEMLADGSLDPEEALHKKEKLEWLENVIVQLPVEQKQVVLLRVYSEMPFKEIARF